MTQVAGVERARKQDVPARMWPVFVVTLVVFGVLAWNRRWMADDGLIVLRTVRQILAGHGPVYNIGERVEVNTSPLWTAVLTVLALVLPVVSLEWLAVVTGLACALGGLAFGLDAARRLYGGPVVPAGALVMCALTPFLDFATSGLETGLILLWLGGTWWLLVRGSTWPLAVVAGLGPLVRPDLAVVSVVIFVALLVLRRPGWRRGLGLTAVAAALPLAYQVFRMGYYGLLTPNPALVKEASDANWARGFAYLGNLLGPQLLWLPLVVLGVVYALVRTSRLEWVPVIAAVPLAGYVIRVGGDFMHGRMLLPALFCLLLPVFAVPVSRRVLAGVLVVAVWAVGAGGWLRPPFSSPRGVTDERAYWVAVTGHEHPVAAADFAGYDLVPGALAALARTTAPTTLAFDRDRREWLAHGTDQSYTTVSVGTLGAVGLLADLDVRVVDSYGLASPTGSHVLPDPGGRTGHQKWLSPVWQIADSGGDVRSWPAVREALDCPALREVSDAARAPLTAGRFFANLTGAFTRQGVRFARDPEVARTCALPTVAE